MADEYPDFFKSTGYGTGEGLCGWNCRHSFFPFYPGISQPHYTAEALAALNEKSVEYQGKKYTRYEISQMQRALERQVRVAKRKCLAEEAAGLSRGQFPVGPTGANAGHVMPGKGIVTKFAAKAANFKRRGDAATRTICVFVTQSGTKCGPYYRGHKQIVTKFAAKAANFKRPTARKTPLPRRWAPPPAGPPSRGARRKRPVQRHPAWPPAPACRAGPPPR